MRKEKRGMSKKLKVPYPKLKATMAYNGHTVKTYDEILHMSKDSVKNG